MLGFSWASKATLCNDSYSLYCSITVLQSMKLGIDVNRHKEIIVKSISALLLLLLKHFRLNHIYQVSSQECFSTGLRYCPGPISLTRDTRAFVVQVSIFQPFLCLTQGIHIPVHNLGLAEWDGMWGTLRKVETSVHYLTVMGRSP